MKKTKRCLLQIFFLILVFLLTSFSQGQGIKTPAVLQEDGRVNFSSSNDYSVWGDIESEVRVLHSLQNVKLNKTSLIIAQKNEIGWNHPKPIYLGGGGECNEYPGDSNWAHSWPVQNGFFQFGIIPTQSGDSELRFLSHHNMNRQVMAFDQGLDSLHIFTGMEGTGQTRWKTLSSYSPPTSGSSIICNEFNGFNTHDIHLTGSRELLGFKSSAWENLTEVGGAFGVAQYTQKNGCKIISVLNRFPDMDTSESLVDKIIPLSSWVQPDDYVHGNSIEKQLIPYNGSQYYLASMRHMEGGLFLVSEDANVPSIKIGNFTPIGNTLKPCLQHDARLLWRSPNSDTLCISYFNNNTHGGNLFSQGENPRGTILEVVISAETIEEVFFQEFESFDLDGAAGGWGSFRVLPLGGDSSLFAMNISGKGTRGVWDSLGSWYTGWKTDGVKFFPDDQGNKAQITIGVFKHTPDYRDTWSQKIIWSISMEYSGLYDGDSSKNSGTGMYLTPECRCYMVKPSFDPFLNVDEGNYSNGIFTAPAWIDSIGTSEFLPGSSLSANPGDHVTGYDIETNTSFNWVVKDTTILNGPEYWNLNPSEKGWDIYPNPSKDFIKIKGSFIKLKGEIEIFDPRGKLIVTRIMTDQKVFVGDLPSGIYFVKILGLKSKPRKLIIL